MSKYGHGKYGVGPYKCFELITHLIRVVKRTLGGIPSRLPSRPLNMGKGTEKDIPNMIRNVQQLWNLFNQYDHNTSRPLNMGKGTLNDIPNLIKNISQLWNRCNRITSAESDVKIYKFWE